MPTTVSPIVREHEFALAAAPVDVCASIGDASSNSLLLEGSAGAGESWVGGPLVAVGATVPSGFSAAAPGDSLTALSRLVRRRRRAGGTGATGVAALFAYDLLDGSAGPRDFDGTPRLVVVEVDRSLRFLERGRVCLTLRGSDVAADAPERMAATLVPVPASPPRPATAKGPHGGQPRTSLPREAYLRAVQRIREHIARGDIYQGNLCQQFSLPWSGSSLELYRANAARAAAPRSAFVEVEGLAIASVSPETFVRVTPPDLVETLPIKGTRPRDDDPAEDRRLAQELLDSAKDRAELIMIVDLERNDLGRVCRTGSVEVPELARLQSFAAVHHLIARVRGRLKPDGDLETLIRAVYPGGSITGAPKLRAIEILREIEPVRRSFFTGSLFWFGDDGGTDSSILIRTAELRGGSVRIGAGGGIVADSEPEAEWRESNHKARALTRSLGFEPEEAQ